jgi:microcystin degradation protein MlrC
MKVFVAGIATETNTFATLPTGMGHFIEAGIHRCGEARDEASMLPTERRLRALAAEGGHDLLFGLMADAQPLGRTMRAVWETLRDELIDDLRAVLPVQAVLLLLHGAMVAEGCDDCEGDLITRVRETVGPAVPIGVELDLHCHTSEAMLTRSDVVIAYKEYPHTDVVERVEEVWRLTLATATGRVRPVTAAWDCRMISFWHTTREPMIGFVQRMKSLEGRDGVLSVSFGHGFPYGDVADNGAKVWVITDGDRPQAAALAEQLGREVWAMREQTRPSYCPLDDVLDQMLAAPPGLPVVIADRADNPGGGAMGDSTFVLHALVDRGIGNVALGAFWDLGALACCRDAGVGSTFDLRLGGKCGPTSGDAVDLRVTVRAVLDNHVQHFGKHKADCGAAAWVSTDDGLDIVIIAKRQQVLGRDLFTGLGIDLAGKRVIVVKSSQHFHADFAPIASRVLYADTPGLLRSDLENLPYRQRSLNYWPRVDDPWATTS